MRVGVYEFKNRVSELIEAAERGEEVVITRHGEPVVRLVKEPTEEERIVARRLAMLEEAGKRHQAFLADGGVLRPYEALRADVEEGRR